MIDQITPEKILFAGDWHGSIVQVKRAVEEAQKKGADTIIHVGDFGIWSDDTKYLFKLNRFLQSADITLYFVDGNHENFPRLYGYPLAENGVRPIRSRIFHLPRGFRWEWGGVSFLAMGGAASIDYEMRTKHINWWPEEILSEADIERGIEAGKVDVMICHDSPANAPNSICDDAIGQASAAEFFGEEGLLYATEHRKLLQRVVDVAQPQMLFHGHYHRNMAGYFHNADGSTGRVIGLDQGTQPVYANTLTLTVSYISQFCETLRMPLDGPAQLDPK